jgi:hypothetical protein
LVKKNLRQNSDTALKTYGKSEHLDMHRYPKTLQAPTPDSVQTRLGCLWQSTAYPAPAGPLAMVFNDLNALIDYMVPFCIELSIFDTEKRRKRLISEGLHKMIKVG